MARGQSGQKQGQQYKDNGDNCFEFSSSKAECTTDAKEIEVQ